MNQLVIIHWKLQVNSFRKLFLTILYKIKTLTYLHSIFPAKMIENGLMTPVYAPELPPLTQSAMAPHNKLETGPASTKGTKPKIISLRFNRMECCHNRTYATSFCRQWYLLFSRTMLCLRRDRSLALMRFFIHLCIALLVGTLYFNIGNDAAMMYNNFRYIVLSQMFLLFTSFCSMTILCKSKLLCVFKGLSIYLHDDA